MKIKFGTDGWRAIIAKEFTTDNVARVTTGVAKWIQSHSFDLARKEGVVVGHDCRFGGELFAETVARVLVHNGIKVYLSKGFVSTPMISFATSQLNACLGVIITASHNPASDNGYKLKGHYGGPMLSENVKEIEALIPDVNEVNLDDVSFEQAKKDGLFKYLSLETMYCDHIEKSFDLNAIRNSKMNFAYDAMYGAGQNVMKRLFPEATLFRCDHNPSFFGIAPEPIMKNLLAYSDFIKRMGDIDIGFATDGDADRIGLMDGKGNFIDSHHIMLLLIHYLCKYKGMKGKVATGFSSTVKIKTLCDYYGLPLDVVPIGFKYICGIMINEDVLMGGEESGGIAIKGHIPERDGIWIGLTLLEFMAKSGKTLEGLIDEVYDLVGEFAFERDDLRLHEKQKDQIVKNCQDGIYKSFGEYRVKRLETMDGFKYILNDYEWVMIRPSGTEPVLRTYAESDTPEHAKDILKALHGTILTS